MEQKWILEERKRDGIRKKNFQSEWKRVVEGQKQGKWWQSWLNRVADSQGGHICYGKCEVEGKVPAHNKWNRMNQRAKKFPFLTYSSLPLPSNKNVFSVILNCPKSEKSSSKRLGDILKCFYSLYVFLLGWHQVFLHLFYKQFKCVWLWFCLLFPIMCKTFTCEICVSA